MHSKEDITFTTRKLHNINHVRNQNQKTAKKIKAIATHFFINLDCNYTSRNHCYMNVHVFQLQKIAELKIEILEYNSH